MVVLLLLQSDFIHDYYKNNKIQILQGFYKEQKIKNNRNYNGTDT